MNEAYYKELQRSRTQESSKDFRERFRKMKLKEQEHEKEKADAKAKYIRQKENGA